jgi:hypothetical protein
MVQASLPVFRLRQAAPALASQTLVAFRDACFYSATVGASIADG